MAEELGASLERLTCTLRKLNQELQSTSIDDPEMLGEFREAIDDIRTTAWKVHELAHARHAEHDPNAVLALVARERLKRFEHMANNICADLDSGLLHRDTTRQSLEFRIAAIGKRLSA